MASGLANLQKLKPKHLKVIDAFVLGVPIDEAMVMAGFASSSAERMGRQLLDNPLVQQAIADKRRARNEVLAEKLAGESDLAAQRGAEIIMKASFRGEDVVREAARIALLDPRRLFGENNEMLAPKDWPDDIAAAIASIEIDELVVNEVRMGFIKKVKFWPKMSAIDSLLTHLGLAQPAKDRESFGRTIHIHMGEEKPQVRGPVRVGALTIEADE